MNVIDAWSTAEKKQISEVIREWLSLYQDTINEGPKQFSSVISLTQIPAPYDPGAVSRDQQEATGVAKTSLYHPEAVKLAELGRNEAGDLGNPSLAKLQSLPSTAWICVVALKRNLVSSIAFSHYRTCHSLNNEQNKLLACSIKYGLHTAYSTKIYVFKFQTVFLP